MGLEQRILADAERQGVIKGEKKGEKKGIKIGLEQGIILTNLILSTDISDAEIAKIAGVDIQIVTKVRAKIASDKLI